MTKIDRIIIKGEGKQIIEVLTKKYGITKAELIQQYAEKLRLYETTIEQYLKNKTIKNKKFKKILEEDCGMSYKEAIQSTESQVIFYIESMRSEIYKYNEEKDILNTRELIQLCQQFKQDLSYYCLIAIGNLGRIKSNMGLHIEARSILEEVIKEAQVLGYIDLHIYYTTEIAFIYNREEDYSSARKKLQGVEELLNETVLDGRKVFFKYWYVYGSTLKNIERYSIAIEKFKLAFKYTEDLKDEIDVLLNIGNCYQLDKKYKEAKKWYEKAFKVSKDNHVLFLVVLNQMALFYYEKNDIPRANIYINRVMELISEVMDIDKKVKILESYLLIIGDCEVLLKEVMNILLDTEKYTENMNRLYGFLDKFIEKLLNQEDLRLLTRLMDQLRLIIKLKENNRQKGLDELKVRFADIMVWLVERGYRYLS